jgi:NitT/TauT family transport system substrate-binding protein
MIVANGDFLKKQPEAARAFMAAEAEAVAYIKDPVNKDEIVQLIMDKLELKKEDAAKSVDFVLPGLADKGKMNLEGVKWAIDTTKQTGAIKSNLALDKLVDESYYAK